MACCNVYSICTTYHLHVQYLVPVHTMHTYVCTYIHTSISTTCICIGMQVITYLHTYSVYVRTYVHMVCTYAHRYVHMVCMYTHTYVHAVCMSAHTGTKLHYVNSPSALLYSRIHGCVSVGLVQAHGGVTQCEHLKTHACLQGGDLRQSGQIVPVQVQHHQVGEPTPEAAAWYVAQLPPQEGERRRIGVAVETDRGYIRTNSHTQHIRTYICTYL